jgi:hypothetical protein
MPGEHLRDAERVSGVIGNLSYSYWGGWRIDLPALFRFLGL